METSTQTGNSAATETARRLLAMALDLLYPPRCGGCNSPGSWFCDACRARIVPPMHSGWICSVCQRELTPRRGVLSCPSVCSPDRLVATISIGIYGGPLEKAIHNLKYSGWRALAPDLGALLTKALLAANAELSPWSAEATPSLLPLPLHRRRKRWRGFNQSELLASEMSFALGWPLISDLHRVVATSPQARLGGAARRRNVAGAFSWRGAAIPPTPIILVDDVLTTGSTIHAAIDALIAAGSAPVYVAVLASAAKSKQETKDK